MLTSTYGVSRRDAVDSLVELIRKETIELWHMDEAAVLQALFLCRESNRTSFADALLWANARASAHPVVYTFDQRFPVDGVTLRDS